MTNVPTPAWRTHQNALILAAAGAFALLTLGILLTRPSPDQLASPGPPDVASLPPASPGTVTADYRGIRWRLTAVTDRRGTTEIPSSVDAWLHLAADGELLASDDVNGISGRFATTSAGFDVTETTTTAVLYAVGDLAQRAAMTGINAVTVSADVQPLHVTVLSADREHLNVQANGVRLTFVRNGAQSPHEPRRPARDTTDN
ncbi:hypothetical protein QLQ12_12555 [Actinoplanes sp. NEAU-A12]|uniref:LPS export ABC transporter periplasmic protein LptC n=1 Tax=Actinoplanes sandaracinus TaxID=3045177 RepID=A0ABT6WIC7_9ACTN|nr:hypothetical protein [Actinoplanes sandaracinus]MDI6099425.1 hypothetical protein [Actinoplanes sandaracinus]